MSYERQDKSQSKAPSSAYPSKFVQSKRIKEASILGNQMMVQRFKNATPIQRKLMFDDGTKYLDNSQNVIAHSAYNRVQDKARKYYDKHDLLFVSATPAQGAASFVPGGFLDDDKINIAPIPDNVTPQNKPLYVNDALIEVTHETQHALDQQEGGLYTSDQKVISEFHAFAVQSAMSRQIENANGRQSAKYQAMRDSFADPIGAGFTPGNMMFNIIKTYLNYYTGTAVDDTATSAFIKQHTAELQRAVAMYNSLATNTPGEHDQYQATEVEEVTRMISDTGTVSVEEVEQVSKKVSKNVYP